MADVYITPTGRKYHARTDQECMRNASACEEVSVNDAHAMGLQPCDMCDAPRASGVTEEDVRWSRAIESWDNEGKFAKSKWERAFASKVLSKVSSLSPDDVEPQARILAGGKYQSIDFLIESARIVIEIDGGDKSGSGPSPADLERRNRRDADMTASGFQALHFSNHQVAQQPDDCLQKVENLLTAHQTPSSVEPASPPTAATTTPTSPPTLATPAADQPTSKRGFAIYAIGGGVGLVVALVAVIAIGNSSTTSDTNLETGTQTNSAVGQTDEGQTEANSGDAASSETRWVEPLNDECPADYPFKGKIKGGSEPDGDDFLHPAGGKFYDITEPNRCYAIREDAYADGFVEKFSNCTEAREAGVTPIGIETSPDLYEVNKNLDGDEDGIACE